MTASASGTLAATPLAHGLVYSRNRRLTGRYELSSAQASAVVTLWRGALAGVETTPSGACPGGYFGAVAYELGLIDSATLDATLLVIARTKRLHGEVLIERGAITAEQRDQILTEQIHRKVHWLFSLGDDTGYAFYDTVADSPPTVAIDSVGPVWRGLRDHPPTKFVEETVRRIGDQAIRRIAGASVVLPPDEATLFDALRDRPMTLAEMQAKTELSSKQVELLVYLLVISRCVEATSGARTHPSTGALPAAMPSGPAVRRVSGPVEIPRIPAPTVVPHIEALPKRPPPGSLAALQTPSDLGPTAISRRAGTVEDETYFEALGVERGASTEAVRAAFLRLAKSWHPDRIGPELASVRNDVARIFSHMTLAHQTLTRDEPRRNYIASLAVKRAGRPREKVIAEIATLLERRNFGAILPLAQSLAEEDSDDAEALAVHAWASVHGGEASEEALRAVLPKLDHAVAVDRTSDQAHYYRGLCHKLLGNVPVAFRDFARAMQLNPKHLEAEREVRLFAMRVKKGSGEHKLLAPLLEKLTEKKS